jgi:hypothetical protein
MEEDYDVDEPSLKRCANCGSRAYCSRECQKKAWKFHKYACALIKERKNKEDNADA